MDIPSVARFNFHLEMKEDAVLPAYKGSTFRGGFGNVFKRVVCALRKEECATCPLGNTCIYVYIFETRPPAGSEKLRNIRSIPRPYIIEPPSDSRHEYRAGDTLCFSLVLVGKAIGFLPYFVFTFEELGNVGLGKGKGRYQLREVRSADDDKKTPVYNGRTRKFSPCQESSSSKTLMSRVKELEQCRDLAISFETPTRIEVDDRLLYHPAFHDIFRSLIRRTSNLLSFHCDTDVDWDFNELIRLSESINTDTDSISWYDWERYSSRQDKRMSFGGFIGTLKATGDFSAFALPLALGEFMHVGKHATFGMGKYSISF